MLKHERRQTNSNKKYENDTGYRIPIKFIIELEFTSYYVIHLVSWIFNDFSL